VSGHSKGEESLILIVDDEPIVLQSLQMILEHAGYRSVGAPSGSAAMKVLEGETPLRLVIVDLVLPDIPGEEVLARARALRPGLPLVAMSGLGKRLDEVRASDGIDVYLAKPFEKNALVSTIEKLLGEQQSDHSS